MTQVRRTRISERMKKLQDLVPNMDKVWFMTHILLPFYGKFDIVRIWSLQQTNTADMLDLAVVYIRDLQKQFKVC